MLNIKIKEDECIIPTEELIDLLKYKVEYFEEKESFITDKLFKDRVIKNIQSLKEQILTLEKAL
jgi:hypothetical protein